MFYSYKFEGTFYYAEYWCCFDNLHKKLTGNLNHLRDMRSVLATNAVNQAPRRRSNTSARAKRKTASSMLHPTWRSCEIVPPSCHPRRSGPCATRQPGPHSPPRAKRRRPPPSPPSSIRIQLLLRSIALHRVRCVSGAMKGGGGRRAALSGPARMESVRAGRRPGRAPLRHRCPAVLPAVFP